MMPLAISLRFLKIFFAQLNKSGTVKVDLSQNKSQVISVKLHPNKYVFETISVRFDFV